MKIIALVSLWLACMLIALQAGLKVFDRIYDPDDVDYYTFYSKAADASCLAVFDRGQLALSCVPGNRIRADEQ